MDDFVKNAKGSESRDVYKWWHKQIDDFYNLPEAKKWYAIDIDLCLVDFDKGILAFLDYKKPTDKITSAEKVVYDELLEKGYDVFLIVGELPKIPQVYKYTKGGGQMFVSNNCIEWEMNLRKL